MLEPCLLQPCFHVAGPVAELGVLRALGEEGVQPVERALITKEVGTPRPQLEPQITSLETCNIN